MVLGINIVKTISRGFSPLSLQYRSLSSRSFSTVPRGPDGKKIAIAFDIDGVLLRSGVPIGGSELALNKITSVENGGSHPTGIPYIFLTNGSGMTEPQKASQLTSRLGISVPASKVILAHSPLHTYDLPKHHRKILIVGMSELKDIAASFGFAEESVTTPDEHMAKLRAALTEEERLQISQSIDAIVVITDSSNWETDVGACAHVVSSHQKLANHSPVQQTTKSENPSLLDFYVCNHDWVFSADCDMPRMAGGSFVSTILKVTQQYVNDIDIHEAMNIYYLGKPFHATYRYAESLLGRQIDIENAPSSNWMEDYTIYAFGDNPAADFLGANDALTPWVSCAVRTGTIPIVEENLHPRMRPQFYFDDVLQGVEWLLQQK